MYIHHSYVCNIILLTGCKTTVKWISFTPWSSTCYAPKQTLLIWGQNTMRRHYNTVNFHQNHHNRCLIARPSGRVMGCLLWGQALIYVLPLPLKSYMCPVILQHIIRTLHCICFLRLYSMPVSSWVIRHHHNHRQGDMVMNGDVIYQPKW